MYRTDDPLADFSRWEKQQEEMAEDLPECDYCGRKIDDHFFNINGDIICEDCLNANFRETVEI